MFQIGADIEFGHLRERRNRRAVVLIGSGTIIVPLLLGLSGGWLAAPVLAPGVDRLTFGLFIAVALAITAMPVLGRILQAFDLMRTRIGTVTIASAAANDVVGWLLLAAISASVTASFTGTAAVFQLAGLILLLLAARMLGRPLVGWLLRVLPIESAGPPTLSPGLMTVVTALVFTGAMATYQLGVFAIFGGFLVGTLFHDRPTFIAAWQRQIGQFVLVFFLPVFFTLTGLRTDIGGLSTSTEWLALALFLTAAIAGKMLPAYVAARLCGFDPREGTMIGAMMNTRGLMELVVLNVGYDLGILPPAVFTMLVIVAIVTTVMTAPILRVCLRRTQPALVLRSEA